MLWEVDQVPVSMAGYSGPTPNGMRVGNGYPSKNRRCSGYASAYTAGVSQFILEHGFKFCFLYTDRQHPTTNKIFQQIWYHPICDIERYDFLAE
jgi:predicted GNAT family acetyltransferase